MNWTCEAFERWLDQGRPAAMEAETHVSGCARCARSLHAALAIDEALGLVVAAVAPPSFTDDVLRRAHAARAFASTSSLAWWVRVGAEPAVAGACVLVALLFWRGSALWNFAGELSLRLGAWSNGAFDLLSTVTVVRALTSPAAILGWAPPLFAASWWLFRWSERLIARRMVTAR